METCERQDSDPECDDEADEVIYTFDQLSDRAKDQARDDYREGGYLDYDWWDGVYEDAIRMAALIGIEIDHTIRKTTKGKEYREPQIHFSGFCSQGDGACFEGEYVYRADAIQQIQQETNDEELLRIAQELGLLQVTHRLKGMEPFSASITTNGNYSHSGTMNVKLIADDDDGESEGNTLECDEDEVQQLMRDFADWIYKNLEDENDYLCSDEHIDQYLVDETFDEEGCIV